MNVLAKTPEGAARIARIVDKAEHYLADRLAEGDQRVAQGGIDGDAPPAVPTSEAFVPIDVPDVVVPSTVIEPSRKIDTTTTGDTERPAATTTTTTTTAISEDGHDDNDDAMADQHDRQEVPDMDIGVVTLASGRPCRKAMADAESPATYISAGWQKQVGTHDCDIQRPSRDHEVVRRQGSSERTVAD